MRPLALALALGLAAPALAQDLDRGAQYFWTYCAACHGDDATGGGPMTEIMTVQPPDLTKLTARNDGVFPTAMVVYRIDGRDIVLAHGGRMPIYGDIFGAVMVPIKTEAGQPILAGEGIADIVTYLKTIQQ